MSSKKLFIITFFYLHFGRSKRISWFLWYCFLCDLFRNIIFFITRLSLKFRTFFIFVIWILYCHIRWRDLLILFIKMIFISWMALKRNFLLLFLLLLFFSWLYYFLFIILFVWSVTIKRSCFFKVNFYIVVLLSLFTLYLIFWILIRVTTFKKAWIILLL